MKEIRAITMDLDDTLWAVEPVLQAAEQRLYDWLAAHCPRVAGHYSIESMRELRLAIARQQQDIAHDLTEVRHRSLQRIIVEEGTYPQSYVDRAMAVFLEHRNRVELFPDVLPFLNRVSRRYPLLSISNGNADPGRIGLRGLFVTHISARDVGAAKPDARVFQAACDRLGLDPQRVLHIGDHPVQDILGAARVGMKTVWVNRFEAHWEAGHRADYEVTSLEQVLDLLPLHRVGDPQ